MKPKIDTHGHLVNEQIRYPKLQVISEDGVNVGVITREQAMLMARTAGLDLVLVSDTGSEGSPVAKVMDFGKVLYAKKKKLAEAKKHQKTIQVKEIKMRPKIGDHDFQTKLKQAIQFLQDGKHLKVTLMFRGRETATSQERGTEMFNKIITFFQENGLDSINQDKEMRAAGAWSRIYFLK